MSLTERDRLGLTGSHCTVSKVIPEIERLVRAGAKYFPFSLLQWRILIPDLEKPRIWRENYKNYRKEAMANPG